MDGRLLQIIKDLKTEHEKTYNCERDLIIKFPTEQARQKWTDWYFRLNDIATRGVLTEPGLILTEPPPDSPRGVK